MPLLRLLVGYDGSVPAREALRTAATLLRGGGACTVLSVAAYPTVGGSRASSSARPTAAPIASPSEGESPHSHPWSDEAALILRRLGAAATIRVATGIPAAALIRAARDDATDLVILGHHGREARRPPVLGDVTRRLIAGPPCSILIAGTRPITAVQRILVVLPSTPPEDTAIHAAVTLARHCGATLLLLQVVDGETPAEPAKPTPRHPHFPAARSSDSALALAWAVQTCQRLGVDPHVDVVRGAFTSALTAHAVRLSADVVSLGAAPSPAHVDAIYRDVGAAVLAPPLPPPLAT